MMRPPIDGATAVALSGGGSRAYVAALGQLEALRALGLIDNVDHVAGVSGGAWAAVVDSWLTEQTTTRRSPILAPSELDLPSLDNLAAGGAPHGAVCRENLLFKFARGITSGMPAYAAWRSAVHATILAPLGVPQGAPLSTLTQAPRQHQPRPHVAAAVLGPARAAPFAAARRRFSCLDLSPSGIRHRGVLWAPERFPAPSGGHGRGRAAVEESSPRTLTVSDALATSSYFPAALLATRASPPPSQQARTKTRVRHGRATGASRGGAVERLRVALGERWQCALPASALRRDRTAACKGGDADGTWLLGDGGACQNMPLPLLLGLSDGPPVRRCLCIFNVGEALPPIAGPPPRPSRTPSSSAAAPADENAADDGPFCEDFGALFGVRAASAASNLNKDLARSQVFERRHWRPLVRALQESASRGEGAVATTKLTTVRNRWWNVEAGRDVTVTWMYICRAPEWEQALPAATRAELPPASRGATNRLGDASRAGPLRFAKTLVADVTSRRRRRLDSFPQYPLTRLRLSPVEASALYQLSGHVVRAHARELRALFAPDIGE